MGFPWYFLNIISRHENIVHVSLQSAVLHHEYNIVHFKIQSNVTHENIIKFCIDILYICKIIKTPKFCFTYLFTDMGDIINRSSCCFVMVVFKLYKLSKLGAVGGRGSLLNRNKKCQHNKNEKFWGGYQKTQLWVWDQGKACYYISL